MLRFRVGAFPLLSSAYHACLAARPERKLPILVTFPRKLSAVVLLRAVGHVLEKVDGKRSPEYQKAIEAAWSSLNRSRPDPQIFWAFIEDERNNILKEYQLSAGQGVTVHLGSSRPADYHYVINTGPFAGREQRELLREAISWWETYLDRIDREASDDAL